MGRGTEQGHVPVPREDSLPRPAARPRDPAQRLREVLGAVAEGAVLLLQPQLRPAEPERPLHPEGIRRQARSADRSQHLVGGRHRAAVGVRAVEGREVRRLRHLAQRLRLAGIQGHGAGDEEDAERHDRMGEGIGRGLAGRRLLLQPLPGAGEGPGEGVDQREPPGLLPQDRDAAVAGPPRLRGCEEPAAVPPGVDDRGRALRGAVGLRARQGQGRQLAVRARPVEGPDASSRRSSRRSTTTPSASSTTSATSCSSAPTAARRTGRPC